MKHLIITGPQGVGKTLLADWIANLGIPIWDGTTLQEIKATTRLIKNSPRPNRVGVFVTNSDVTYEDVKKT